MRRTMLASMTTIALLALGTTAGAGELVEGHGTVQSVDAEAPSVNIDHDPIDELGWPQMVMDLDLADASLADDLAAGDEIMFYLRENEEGDYEIAEVDPH